VVIVVAGEALIDLVPADDGTLVPHAGGGPFNTARALGRLGCPVAYLGRVSTDRFSARLAYTYRSEYYGSYDRGTRMHMDAYGTLAASVNVKLSDTFSINFDALNLNNPTMKYYGDNKEQPRAFYTNGIQYYLTLNAKY